MYSIRLRILFVIIVGGLLSLGSSCDSGGEDWGSSLRGTVFDSATQQPLSGVMIYVNDSTLGPVDPDGTDSTGAFMLGDFGYWEFETYLRCPGYRPKDTVLGTKRYRSDVTGVKILLSPE